MVPFVYGTGSGFSRMGADSWWVSDTILRRGGPWAVALTALVTVTAAGVLVPALRASHTDPIRGLRIQ
jgi:hypothetical protein